MKTIEEKLAVMRGWLEGKTIQYKTLDEVCWADVDNPIWYWEKYDYRIKPEPAPKRRVPLGPEDLPAVCWVKDASTSTAAVARLVLAVSPTWVRVVFSTEISDISYTHLMVNKWEFSPDRKTWKPMWKEVE